ncbi:probable methyltransferase-like protein 24 [Mercenaria mercenaria]|uniref:probable methyltransferase-like protein 24 n=1 Tax=Mercenaria mercenaria TaxID=6596 RepID=UPI00234EF7F2|nr:probable methyltransferase-like protein 24 [Mercenaria mercenaria]
MLCRHMLVVYLFLSLIAFVLMYFAMDKYLESRRPFDNGESCSVEDYTRNINLLPNDTEIDKMGEDNLTLVYWKYINSIQVLCRNQMRFGDMKDGGKEVCLDEKYKPKYPCLVYSFGSNFQFDFELSIIKHFNCEIHTFDPTKSIKSNSIPNGINFHLFGLSDTNSTNTKGWRMQTLSGIRKHLNHTERVLDILKIDIEGGEWTAFPEIFQSGVLKYVKQICIEIHFGKTSTNHLYYTNWGDVSSKNQLKVLRNLYEQGFRIFMHEHNLFAQMRFRQPYSTITTVNEISLINIR